VFRTAKWSPMLCLLIAWCTPSAHAQGTYTAATCNQSDVNAIINGPTHTAVNGDTIQIPSGSCTWSSGITLPPGIGISIIGNGTPNTGPGTSGAGTVNTTISSNYGGQLFTASPTYGNSTMRISTLKITVSASSDAPILILGTCTSSGCPGARLDNLIVPTSNFCSISDATFARIDNIFGVADHNTVGDTQPSCNGVDFINVGHGNWKGVNNWGDNSWASADTFGSNQAFYLENNIFNYAFGTDTDYGDGAGDWGGGRIVCRFNTFNDISPATACTNHGTDTTGRWRGGRQFEFYKNTGSSNSSFCGGGCNAIWGERSGAAIVWGNSFTGSFNSVASVDTQRRWRVDAPWGPCDGSTVWDTDDGTTYYSGTIGSVTTTTGGIQKVPVYVVADSDSLTWTINKWASVSGAPYSFHDVTQNFGFEIYSNTSNVLTAALSCAGGTGCSQAPASSDSYQILRATVCMDQPGRGAGVLLGGGDGNSGDPETQGSHSPFIEPTIGSTGPVNEVLDPIYEVDNSAGSLNTEFVSNDSQGLIANRDFYAQSIGQAAQTSETSPFNGTSGTGYGTLANRPTTCTPSVGYLATDQGSWNQSGSGGQGELFVCTATNTWSLYYTPYIYPHPLIAGGTTVVNPPTNLTVVVQ